MRQGQVFVKNQLAGIITEDETGYETSAKPSFIEKFPFSCV